MKRIIPFAVLGLLVTTAAVHPQPYDPDDRGFPPPQDFAPPPEDRPPSRMICFVDPPFPFPARRCPTHPGYPGSPCRCSGSFFEGQRDYIE